jgi:hypothetical protein
VKQVGNVLLWLLAGLQQLKLRHVSSDGMSPGAFDVNSGCSGFVYALNVGARPPRREAPVLLLGRASADLSE